MYEDMYGKHSWNVLRCLLTHVLNIWLSICVKMSVPIWPNTSRNCWLLCGGQSHKNSLILLFTYFTFFLLLAGFKRSILLVELLEMLFNYVLTDSNHKCYTQVVLSIFLLQKTGTSYILNTSFDSLIYFLYHRLIISWFPQRRFNTSLEHYKNFH